MNETAMRAAFEQWWRDSYGLPPGPHAVMTHVAWVEHVLNQPVPELPSGLVEEWSSMGGEATLAESDQHIAKQAVAWAWEQRHAQ
jgi:hypothetical protein